MNKRDAADPIIFRKRPAKKTQRCLFIGRYSNTRCTHDALPGSLWCKLHPDGMLS